jgi:hemerythrin superfamily protein
MAMIEPAALTAARLPAGMVSRDAISILREDHRRIEELFRQFEKTRGQALRGEVAGRICAELLIHARVEEEIFYPALRRAIDDEELMDEADVEHETAAALIAEIRVMRADQSHYAARVKVLGEYVRHHIQEEQNRMFSKARQARLDMRSLGEQIIERKEELKQTLYLYPQLVGSLGRAEEVQ